MWHTQGYQDFVKCVLCWTVCPAIFYLVWAIPMIVEIDEEDGGKSFDPLNSCLDAGLLWILMKLAAVLMLCCGPCIYRGFCMYGDCMVCWSCKCCVDWDDVEDDIAEFVIDFEKDEEHELVNVEYKQEEKVVALTTDALIQENDEEEIVDDTQTEDTRVVDIELTTKTEDVNEGDTEKIDGKTHDSHPTKADDFIAPDKSQLND